MAATNPSAAAQQFDAPRTEEGEREQRVEREERDARDDREQDVPMAPSDVDDDRWTSDAGTFTGAGRDEDDDSDSPRRPCRQRSACATISAGNSA